MGKPVALVVGASRGIGRQVAIDLAKNGYAVVVAAKSTSDASETAAFPPDPNSASSTITTVAREITAGGGDALAVQVDVRFEESVEKLISATIATYGRLDVLVYNSGAIYWAPVAKTPLERFRLMQRVNPEGLYAVVQAALPHLSERPAARVVVVSPPIYSRFFRGKTAYAMGKVGMSVLTKGLGMDFAREGRVAAGMDFAREGRVAAGMAICSIWPAVAIESAATQHFAGSSPDELRHLRKPTIFADAILGMLRAPAHTVNGELFLDEDFLRDFCGVSDFAKYAVVPGSEPRRIMPAKLPDLSVAEQDDEGTRIDLAKAKI